MSRNARGRADGCSPCPGGPFIPSPLDLSFPCALLPQGVFERFAEKPSAAAAGNARVECPTGSSCELDLGY